MDGPDPLSDICSPWGGPLERGDAENLAGVLKALADPARLRIVSLLVARGGAYVNDLKYAIGLSQPTTSHHLKVLADAGLVERVKDGVYAAYGVRPEAFVKVAGLLTPPQKRTLRRR